MRELGQDLEALGPDEVDLEAIERRVQELANAWGREQMACAMRRADTEAPEVVIDGRRWGNRRLHPCEYHTVFGAFTLERSVYQQSGRGRVAVPMDLRLGIVEGAYTPRVARIATRALAGMPEQEAAELLADVSTATLSSPTIGRLSRAIAARYEQRRVGETSPTLPGPRDARRRPASPASGRRSARKGPRGAGARRRTPRFRAPGGSPPPWVVRPHAVHRSSTRRTRRREPRAAARGSSSTEALGPAPSVVARWARRCREGNAGPAGGGSREPRVSCARRSAHSARRRSRSSA